MSSSPTTLAGKKRVFSAGSSSLLQLARIMQDYDGNDDGSYGLPEKKQRLIVAAPHALGVEKPTSQMNKSIRSKHFYRLREALINAVKADDDTSRDALEVPLRPTKFFEKAIEVQGLTEAEAAKLRDWGGRGIETWDPRDIRRNYENFFGKEYLQTEHRAGREICLYGSFLYTVLCAAYHAPQYQLEKLSKDEFEAELVLMFRHERLMDNRFLAKKTKMTELDRQRLFLAWNIMRIMSKFISGRGNVDYLLFLVAIVDRSGKSYSKGAWTNMSFEAACRRLIIENEGASFQHTLTAGDANSVTRTEESGAQSLEDDNGDDDTHSDDAVAPALHPSEASLLRHAPIGSVRHLALAHAPVAAPISGLTSRGPAETSSEDVQHLLPPPVVSSAAINGALASPGAAKRFAASYASYGGLSSAPPAVAATAAASAPAAVSQSTSAAAAAAAAASWSSATTLSQLAQHRNGAVAAAAVGAAGGYTAPPKTPSDASELSFQTLQSYRAFLQDFCRDKDKGRVVDEVLPLFLDRQRLLQEIADLQRALHQAHEQLRTLQTQPPQKAAGVCPRCQPDAEAMGESLAATVAPPAPDATVDICLRAWATPDTYLPVDVPCSAAPFLRLAQRTQLLRESDVEKLLAHDLDESWVAASMDIRRLYESIFTRAYILEEHRAGREITLFACFLYVVLCKVYHHAAFQSRKVDYAAFALELRLLRLDRALAQNPANLPSLSTTSLAAALRLAPTLPVASVSPLEETRLFQALNIVRVLQRFLSGRPNAEYLLLLLSIADRSGRVYRKLPFAKASVGEALRRLIVERDGELTAMLPMPSAPLPASAPAPTLPPAYHAAHAAHAMHVAGAEGAASQPTLALQTKAAAPLPPYSAAQIAALSQHIAAAATAPKPVGTISVPGPSLIYPNGPPAHLLHPAAAAAVAAAANAPPATAAATSAAQFAAAAAAVAAAQRGPATAAMTTTTTAATAPPAAVAASASTATATAATATGGAAMLALGLAYRPPLAAGLVAKPPPPATTTTTTLTQAPPPADGRDEAAAAVAGDKAPPTATPATTSTTAAATAAGRAAVPEEADLLLSLHARVAQDAARRRP